jgi:toxin-antitoxin system PIN domain toxin
VKLIDLNVLLYVVNADAPLHGQVRRWWEQALNGNEPVALCWPVIAGFVRLATRHGIFPQPLSAADACDRIERWLGLPGVRIATETESHWSLMKQVIGELGAAGNLTTDAHLVALAVSHGATLVSCDHDFARFPGLRWENPLTL